MICLGIESTAHTAAIGVFDENGNILAEIKDMYTRKEGGIIPIEAAKHHKEVFPKLAEQGKLFGFKFSGQWFDIGTWDSYGRANKEWKQF